MRLPGRHFRCTVAGPIRWVGAAAAVIALFHPVEIVRADVFHLTTGGRVEGELLERTDDGYRIRTLLGTVTLTEDAVVQVESAPSPFEAYRRQVAQAGDGPAAQVDLATWCEEHGFRRERIEHLQRALALDPDYEPARRALGYVRVGGFWVDGKTVVDEGAGPPAPADRVGDDEEPEKLAVAIQGDWYRRLRAIRSTLLESPLPRQVAEGRKRVREIEDPLAILPMVQVLSDGNVICRKALLEGLRKFDEGVATANLAAMALTDPLSEIRRDILTELVRRRDERVVAQFRKALRSGNDVLIRRASEALGVLEAEAAIEELIGVLKARRLKRVEVPVQMFFAALPRDFPATVAPLGSTRIILRPALGLSSPTAFIDTQQRLMKVTVFRTEVRDALRRITGVDFGFDREEWARWYEEHKG